MRFPRFNHFPVILAFSGTLCTATSPFRGILKPRLQIRADGDGTSTNKTFDISTVSDLIYMTNITVAGKTYLVQVDTGSSDLWIKGETTPLPNTQQTSNILNISYVAGWASGHVAYAPVNFAGTSVSSQAFLDASTVNNPAIGHGASGIVGLGFTTLSNVDVAVSAAGSSTGKALLFNIFAQNTSQPNFIGFSLQRSKDGSTDDVDGKFSVGVVEPVYAAVMNKPAIPTWPVKLPQRWNVLLDAVLVGDRVITPTTTVRNAPGNRAVILLDNGSSFTYAPEEICNAIYANVSGAQFDQEIRQWTVPCSAEIDMALQIGGQVFPLHPLDVTPASDNTTCLGSFIPQAVGDGEYDWLVGVNFLRSVYSVYDFGDFDSSGKAGDPYVKLLSLIDPNEASADFHKLRGGSPKTNISYKAAAVASFALSMDAGQTLERIENYIPALLGLVALNALILIVLAICGTVIYCRRRATSPLREHRGRATPVQMDPINSYIAGARAHMYEPVSMALTDDTFVPPSPAFHTDGKTSRPGDRPKSVA